jgi:hypothetical protein
LHLPLGSLFLYNAFMANSINVRRKKRGRPATGTDPLVATRMPPALIKSIDNWAEKYADGSRSGAIRRMVEMALSISEPTKQTSREAAAKASDMAGQRIDEISDLSATAEEQQDRKRRLIKGPSEFRHMRGDRPKPKG